MLFIALLILVLVSFLIRAPRLVGDVHAHLRYIVFYIAVGFITCRKVVFVGDIIDGPKGWPLWKSSMAIKLIRWCPWANCLMGNHEAYSAFSSNAEENAQYWKEQVDEDGNFRPWTEWLSIRKYLTIGDVEWLKSRPLYIQGKNWFACHAKPVLPLPPQYVSHKPTVAQRELFDNTKQWFADGAPYCGSLGTVYVGHTPVTKLKNEQQIWGKVIVLDGNCKKGGKPFTAVPNSNRSASFLPLIMIAFLLFSAVGKIVPKKHNCDVLVHQNIVNSHNSYKLIEGNVCFWDSKNDLLSHVAGADKPLLIIAHGKGVLGESFIGKGSDPVSYSQIGEYKKKEVGIASCRGRETNVSPHPFKEDGLWVFVNYGEALVSSSIEIYNKWKKRGSK
tara:strand:- start:15971 stop:17137 length:1167 start_codon:yes stop_codon:yes gene_type:complete